MTFERGFILRDSDGTTIGLSLTETAAIVGEWLMGERDKRNYVHTKQAGGDRETTLIMGWYRAVLLVWRHGDDERTEVTASDIQRMQEVLQEEAEHG